MSLVLHAPPLHALSAWRPGLYRLCGGNPLVGPFLSTRIDNIGYWKKINCFLFKYIGMESMVRALSMKFLAYVSWRAAGTNFNLHAFRCCLGSSLSVYEVNLCCCRPLMMNIWKWSLPIQKKSLQGIYLRTSSQRMFNLKVLRAPVEHSNRHAVNCTCSRFKWRSANQAPGSPHDVQVLRPSWLSSTSAHQGENPDAGCVDTTHRVGWSPSWRSFAPMAHHSHWSGHHYHHQCSQVHRRNPWTHWNVRATRVLRHITRTRSWQCLWITLDSLVNHWSLNCPWNVCTSQKTSWSDNKLLWEAHVDSIQAKVNRKIGALRRTYRQLTLVARRSYFTGPAIRIISFRSTFQRTSKTGFLDCDARQYAAQQAQTTTTILKRQRPRWASHRHRATMGSPVNVGHDRAMF